MEQIRYRKTARLAVFADVLLCTYSTIVFWKDVTFGADLSDLTDKNIGRLWILSIAYSLGTLVQLTAAILLYLNTRLGQDGNLNESLRSAKLWRIISLIFLGPVLLTVIFTENTLQFVLVLICRIVLVSAATVFTNELKKSEPNLIENEIV